MRKAKCVVYRVNPRERLHTPDDSSYHENQVAAGEVDEIYQDDELSCSFNIDTDSTLNSLLGDANDVIVLKQRKQTLRKKKRKILNVFYIFYIMFFIFYITFMLYPIMFLIFLSYYIFDEYLLLLVLNRMSKKLKSVMKKLFGGKSRVGTANTLFQGCSTTSNWQVEMMKHMGPSLVGPTICSQRDE
jgi:hypothetical protein